MADQRWKNSSWVERRRTHPTGTCTEAILAQAHLARGVVRARRGWFIFALVRRRVMPRRGWFTVEVPDVGSSSSEDCAQSQRGGRKTPQFVSLVCRGTREEGTDFGQSRCGHPDLTNFWPIQFGPIHFCWPIHFWPIQFGPIHFGPKPFGSVCVMVATRVGPTSRKKWDPAAEGGGPTTPTPKQQHPNDNTQTENLLF